MAKKLPDVWSFAANAWNYQDEAGGTFSCWLEDYLELGSRLNLSGGLYRSHIVEWLSHFVSRIDPWETVTASLLNELPDDSSFDVTGSTSNEGWANVGQFTAGFVKELLQS